MYALLGILTGPIGGAVTGYNYAKNQQRIQELDPQAPREWDNPMTNVLVGILFGSLAGASFGWKCGTQEQKIAQLESNARQQEQTSSHHRNNNVDEAYLALGQEQSEWRTRVSEQQAPSEITR